MAQPSGVHPARGPPAEPVYDARTRWWEPERPAGGSGSLSADQVRRWREDGFFVLRNVVDSETVAELRGVVKNILLTPDPEAAGALVDHEPEQPAETRSFEGRMARYRKHNAPGTTFFPLMWHECIAGAWCDVAAEMAPHLGGGDNGDVLVKFNSSFVKQPNGGAATPWHQDNGLWRDGNTDCFSIWMALEAATQAGYERSADFNDWPRSQEGVGRFQLQTRRGRRSKHAKILLVL